MSLGRWGAFVVPLIASLLAGPYLAAAPSGAEPFALIAAVKGRVEVVEARGGKSTRVSFGRPLERGDRVVVAPGGSATVYFSDGNLIELAEKSAVTVGGRVGPRAKTGPGAELSSSVYTQVSRFVSGGSRETGLVALSGMRGAEERTPLIVAPRRTDLLTDRPGFAWRAAPGAVRYRVSVSGDQGQLWNREVEGLSLDYPADAPPLPRDADYLWKLEALAERGSVRSDDAAFHVLAEGLSGTVRTDLEKIGETTGGAAAPAAHFLAGSYLFGRGLYQDAADHFNELSRLAPDAPAPHEALGNVYRAIGLMDLAAAEFQRALELTRTQ